MNALEKELIRFLRAAYGFTVEELRHDLAHLPAMRGEAPILASDGEIVAALVGLKSRGLVEEMADGWRRVPEREAVGSQGSLFG